MIYAKPPDDQPDHPHPAIQCCSRNSRDAKLVASWSGPELGECVWTSHWRARPKGAINSWLLKVQRRQRRSREHDFRPHIRLKFLTPRTIIWMRYISNCIPGRACWLLLVLSNVYLHEFPTHFAIFMTWDHQKKLSASSGDKILAPIR